MDDAILLLTLVAVPLVLGALVGYLRSPWWWAAGVAVLLFVVFAIAPAPEQGESRVYGEDAVFLLVASLIVAALAWVGGWLGRRLARRRAGVP